MEWDPNWGQTQKTGRDAIPPVQRPTGLLSSYLQALHTPGPLPSLSVSGLGLASDGIFPSGACPLPLPLNTGFRLVSCPQD